MSAIKIPQPIRTDNRPLYLQAIEAISNLIQDDDYKGGDRLPKESVFAVQLGISRSTLRVALGYLETHGLISRRPGVGTFIATSISSSKREGYLNPLDRMETLLQIAERAGVEASILSREVEDVAASKEIAAELGIAEGDPMLRVKVVEAMDGQPAAYFDTYVALEMIDRNALIDYEGDVITYLSEEVDRAPTHTRSEVLAKNANDEVAEKLGLEERQAVLFLEETFHTKQGDCVVFSRNYFVTEIFRFYLIRRLVTST